MRSTTRAWRGPSRRDRERFAHLAVNALYAEGVALLNLGLAAEAADRFAAADAALARHPPATDFWRPHIAAGRLKATSRLPRFALHTVEGLAAAARAIYERRGDRLDPLFLLLNDEALARAYLAYGNARKAEAVLRPALAALDTTPDVGPLHRVVLLRTAARLHGRLGDAAGRRRYLDRAVGIAGAAGLEHQAGRLAREFGADLAGRAGEPIPAAPEPAGPPGQPVAE